jgi:hypothetical protein
MTIPKFLYKFPRGQGPVVMDPMNGLRLVVLFFEDTGDRERLLSPDNTVSRLAFQWRGWTPF